MTRKHKPRARFDGHVEQPIEPIAEPGHVPGFSPSQMINRTTPGEFNQAVIAEAVMFSATRSLGRGQHQTEYGSTLDEARAHAQRMGVERTLIYAINAAGRQALVEAGGKLVDNSR